MLEKENLLVIVSATKDEFQIDELQTLQTRQTRRYRASESTSVCTHSAAFTGNDHSAIISMLWHLIDPTRF
jgi:hypothetical protein